MSPIIDVLGNLSLHSHSGVGSRKKKTELGNLLKFSQNVRLAKVLTDTGAKTIGEANGYDKIYGTGVRLTDPHTLNKTDWPGNNLMGQMLMNVRQTLLEE